MKFILIRGKSRHFLAVTRQQSRLFVPPATKLGQGNVFTGVCDSVNRGVSSPGGCLLRGCLVRWGWCLLPRGGACSGGWCLFRGVSALGGVVSAPGGVCSWGGAWWRPPGTVTAAGGTHPTRMHSCYTLHLKFNGKLLVK